jgi:UDP-galactose transporter B1
VSGTPFVFFFSCGPAVLALFLRRQTDKISFPVSTTPYLSTATFPTNDKFRSILFTNTVQSLLCVVSAFTFLLVTKRRPGVTWSEILGLPSATAKEAKKKELPNGNSSAGPKRSASQLLRLFAFVALVASVAAPFGFLALSHISFPTLLLGKSCKLVPVMAVNVLLYRRKYPLHKYALVGLVTAGIWAFMAFKPAKAGKSSGRESSSAVGLVLLAINLLLDGVTNATQDHIFSTFPGLDGPQMMFWMNVFSSLITLSALVFPFSLTPSFLLPVSALGPHAHPNELSSALSFIANHPSVKTDILLFGLTGAVGQLFIFATLSLYGSLTLVTITVTRKMMTMLLSVFVFDHKLAKGQWAGVGMVFGAVAMEVRSKFPFSCSARLS